MKAALRLPVSFLLALGFTASVFLFLSSLIHTKVEPTERERAMRIEFSRVRRDSETKTIKRQKPEPVKPPQAAASTAKISNEAVEGIRPSAGPIAIGLGSGVDVDVKGILGGPMAAGGGGGSDRDEMPLVRVQPMYPPRALSQGVEGWALVEFTISAAGTTRDVRAVKAQPEGIFESAAVRAVQAWKYNPKIEAGSAVDRRGVRVLLNFKLSS